MARKSKASAAHSSSARVAGRSRTPPDAARRRLVAITSGAAASGALAFDTSTAPVPPVDSGPLTGAPFAGSQGDADGYLVDRVAFDEGVGDRHDGGSTGNDGREDAGDDGRAMDVLAADSDAEQEDPHGEHGRSRAAGLVAGGVWGSLAERWVPEPLREARIDPGKRGAILLCTVAALAALVAAAAVWLARPTPAPVGAPTAVAAAGASLGVPPASGKLVPLAAADGSDGTSGTTDGGAFVGAPRSEWAPGADRVTGVDDAAGGQPESADAGPAGPILVSVTGKVRRPGVVSVPADARVADAIEAAGGVADLALLAGMNLAAHLTDGASVVVGGPAGNSVAAEAVTGGDAGTGPAAATGGAPARVNINTADSAALQQLPGVGPVTAEAIIAYRTQHGPFTELNQLQEVSGIGPATYARLAPHVGL